MTLATWINQLPVSVLVVYFLIASCESFPINAYTSIIVDDLKAGPAVASRYYAVTNIPWMWKPVYGWLSDNVPVAGFHRKPYIAIGALLAGVAYFWTSKIESMVSLYVATFIRALGNSLMQLMIGSYLVDIARQDVSKSAALQSLANSAKWLGTLTASFLGLIVCTGDFCGSKSSIGPRTAIFFTMIGPALIAVLAIFLPEGRGRTSCQNCRIGPRQGRFALAIIIMQANLVLVGLQNLMEHNVWLRALVASVSISVVLLGVMYLLPCQSPVVAVAEEVTEHMTVSESAMLAVGPSPTMQMSSLRWAAVGSFCFIASALPSSSVVLGQFQYRKFSYEANQQLSIIAASGSVLAALSFAPGFNMRSLLCVFVVGSIVGAVAGLGQLFFVYAAEDLDVKENLNSKIGAIAIVSVLIGCFGSLYSVLPVDTLITHVCGAADVEVSSSLFAVLLSAYSFGGVANGLISAPLLQALGLSSESGPTINWSRLPLWVVVTAMLRLVIVPFLLGLVPITTLRPTAQSVSGN